jgi:hypothetical protein
MKKCLAMTALGLAAIGCGGRSVELELFIVDELVEAPARRAQVLAVAGTDCEALLSTPQSFARTIGRVELEHEARWPVRPNEEVWSDIPDNQSLSIVAAAYDVDDLQIARGCMPVELTGDADAKLRLELRALPACTTAATQLDIMIVLDTSTMMEVVDTELLHLSELVPRVVEGQEYPAGTTWSITTYGDSAGVEELLPPTTDLELLRSTVEMLRRLHDGPARLWDGVYTATGLLAVRRS